MSGTPTKERLLCPACGGNYIALKYHFEPIRQAGQSYRERMISQRLYCRSCKETFWEKPRHAGAHVPKIPIQVEKGEDPQRLLNKAYEEICNRRSVHSAIQTIQRKERTSA